MARSKKSPKDIEKAEVIQDVVTAEVDDAAQIETGDDVTPDPDLDINGADDDSTEITDDVTASQDDASIEDGAAPTDQSDAADMPQAEIQPQTAADPQVIVQKRGFVPLFLGGVLCAGLGYAGANFIKPDGWPFPGSNTNVLQDRLSELETAVSEAQTQTAQMADQLAAARGAFSDLTTAVDAKIADIDLSSTLAPVETALAAIDQRLTTVEAAPVAEAIVSPEATAAYERQLSEMQALLSSEVARLQDAKVAAENEEASAAKASAVSRLQEAITTGQPYDAILDDLDIEVPSALRAPASQGVATLQSIASTFGEAADLAIVETAKSDTENQGWMDRFLRTQLGLRSLTPQDGASSDAILSRAEQAIRDNDLQTALTEISTLPDVGQAVMTDWAATAQTRLDVTNALSAMLAQ